MHRTAAWILLLMFTAFCSYGAEKKPNISLDELVSGRPDLAVTLKGISVEQRNELRDVILDFIVRSYESGVTEGRKKATEECRAERNTQTVIETQIDGEFEGWEGETIVKLMNGQIWQQSSYHYEYHYAYMPDVFIYKSRSGWKMKVEGIDEAVDVVQLK